MKEIVYTTTITLIGNVDTEALGDRLSDLAGDSGKVQVVTSFTQRKEVEVNDE